MVNNVREDFPVLEDPSSGAGVPVTLAQVTDNASTKNTAPVKTYNPDSLYKSAQLLNGTSNAMNVAGSSGTPISFRFTPASGEVWELEEISLVLLDSAAFSNTGFAGHAALTNGVQVNVQSRGVLLQYTLMKKNVDILRAFGDTNLATTQNGFLMTDALLYTTRKFQNRITLSNANSDYVEFVIQDSLTAITAFTADALVRKANGSL